MPLVGQQRLVVLCHMCRAACRSAQRLSLTVLRVCTVESRPQCYASSPSGPLDDSDLLRRLLALRDLSPWPVLRARFFPLPLLSLLLLPALLTSASDPPDCSAPEELAWLGVDWLGVAGDAWCPVDPDCPVAVIRGGRPGVAALSPRRVEPSGVVLRMSDVPSSLPGWIGEEGVAPCCAWIVCCSAG